MQHIFNKVQKKLHLCGKRGSADPSGGECYLPLSFQVRRTLFLHYDRLDGCKHQRPPVWAAFALIAGFDYKTYSCQFFICMSLSVRSQKALINALASLALVMSGTLWSTAARRIL